MNSCSVRWSHSPQLVPFVFSTMVTQPPTCTIPVQYDGHTAPNLYHSSVKIIQSMASHSISLRSTSISFYHLYLDLLSDSSHQVSPSNHYRHLSFHLHVSHALAISCPLSTKQYLVRSTNHETLHYTIFTSHLSLALRPKHLP